jgi:hypothetical protein
MNHILYKDGILKAKPFKRLPCTIDDAHMRYFIVHMHRFLDPTQEVHGH